MWTFTFYLKKGSWKLHLFETFRFSLNAVTHITTLRVPCMQKRGSWMLGRCNMVFHQQPHLCFTGMTRWPYKWKNTSSQGEHTERQPSTYLPFPFAALTLDLNWRRAWTVHLFTSCSDHTGQPGRHITHSWTSNSTDTYVGFPQLASWVSVWFLKKI